MDEGTPTEEKGTVTLGDSLRAAFDEQQAAQAETAEAVKASDEVKVEIPTDDTPPEKEEVKPPEHWSDEDQKAFMEMDEGGREWALRLETNAHKGIEEKAQELKKFREVLEPIKHLVPEGSEAQAIQQLVNAQVMLLNNPQEGIDWLKRHYGVDEKQVPASEEPDEFVDPEIRKLRDKIDEMQKGADAQAQKVENQRQAAMYAEISAFKDATDDDGLTHPHYEKVQGVMAGLLSSNRATDLQDAYDQAVWAVPEYRDSVVEQRIKEQTEKEIAEKAKVADEAKKKAKAVEGKSSAKTSSAPKTMGESLRENYEKSIRGD